MSGEAPDSGIRTARYRTRRDVLARLSAPASESLVVSATAAGTRTAAARAAAARRRFRVLRNLLATRRRFSTALLFRARTREKVGHRVVAFMAAVLEIAVAIFTRNRQTQGPRPGVGLRVVDRHPVVEC